MYVKLFHSMTQAIQILQEAQQEAEELYIMSSGPDAPKLDVMPPPETSRKAKEEE